MSEGSLGAILGMFGRAKAKGAFRDRPKVLSAAMIGAGLTIWEDLRGVGLGWLENVAGVPHFEALAFFRFLDEPVLGSEEGPDLHSGEDLGGDRKTLGLDKFDVPE